MQFQLDLRLKEVKMDDKIFGGASLFVFGDMMQMKPVKGSYIFQKNEIDVKAEEIQISKFTYKLLDECRST